MNNFGVRNKIIISFLALTLIIVGIISSLSFQYMRSLADKIDVATNSASLMVSNSEYSSPKDLENKIIIILDDVKKDANNSKKEMESIFIAVVVGSIILVSAISFLLAEAITVPLRGLIDITKSIIDNKENHIEINTADEFQELANNIYKIREMKK